MVGGHCIGVDPYYLTYKAKKFRYHPQIINSGRYVNDSMGFYVAKQVVKKMIAAGKNMLISRVLVMGATFKEDVTDIRNSRVPDIINELKTYGVHVDIVDPFASSEEYHHEYGISIADGPAGKYDAIIVAVSHTPYLKLDENYFAGLAMESAVVADLKGILRGKINKLTYWSL